MQIIASFVRSQCIATGCKSLHPFQIGCKSLHPFQIGCKSLHPFYKPLPQFIDLLMIVTGNTGLCIFAVLV